MNKVLKNFSYLSIVQVLNYALPLISIPLVSRALGVEKIGLISYIFSYISYFTLMVNYSFNLTSIRNVSKTNNLNYTFSLVFKSQLILFLIAIIIFTTMIFFIKDLRENLILSSVTFLVVIGSFFDKNWVFQYKQDLSIVALANVTLKLIGLVFIVLSIKGESDFILYAIILYGINFLTNFIIFILAIIKYKIKIYNIKNKDIWYFIVDGKMLFFSSVVISLYTSTSVLLLGIFNNNRDVGLYTAATKIIEIGKLFIVTPVIQLIYPIVTQKIADDKQKGVDYVKKLMPLFNVMAIVLLLGSILFGPLALKILYGSEFMDALPLVWILSLTLVFILFSTVFGILLMVNLGMDNLFFKNQLFVAIASVLISILILPYGAGMTSAIILVFSEICITVYQYLCLKSKGYTLFSKDNFSKQSIIDAFKALKSH